MSKKPNNKHNKHNKDNNKDNKDVQLSKDLSFTLRHGAPKQGLKIRSDGFIKMSELLAHPKYKSQTLENNTRIVNESDKQRFLIEEIDDELYIRANQGHSLDVKVQIKQILSLDEIPQSEGVIHGTYQKLWPLIKKSGLKKITRQHIHFAIGLPSDDGVISGMRKTCDMVIFFDLAAAIADGVEFFLSENLVILSPGVDGVLDPKYFSHVLSYPDLKPFDPDFPAQK